MIGATYFAIAVLGIVLLSAIGSVPNEHAAGSGAFVTAMVVGALFTLLVVRELRRDAYQFHTFWIFFGVIAGTGALLVGFEHPIIGKALGAACALTWIGSVAVLAQSLLGKDPRPHVLRQRFAAERIYEHAGVQFVLEVPDDGQRAAGAFDATVFVLNTWDRPRTFSVRLSPRRGIWQVPGGAEVAPEREILTLQGGASGVLVIPVVVTTEQRLRLYVDARTGGSGGRRIWKRPAKTVPMHVSPLATVVLAIVTLGTHLVWGGGLYVKVAPGARRPAPGGSLQRTVIAQVLE